MPTGDGVQQRPTIEQEVATFKGFSTTDGLTSNGKPTAEETAAAAANEASAQAEQDAEGHDDDESPEDKAAREAKEAADAAETLANETPEEKEAREAAETEARANETPEEKEAREAKEAADATAAKKVAKPTVQHRINDLTKARRTAERLLAEERAARTAERQSFERRLETLEGRPLTAANGKGKADPNVTPNPKDFEFGELDAGYITALARFEARQELAAERQTNKTKQQTEADAQRVQEFREKVETLTEKGADKYEDFDEVVNQTRSLPASDPDFWPLSAVMGELILDSDVGPDIAYHLASHPKEARQIFSLPPTKQAAYFGRLEAKFSSTSDATLADPKKKPAAGQAALKVASAATKAPAPPAQRVAGQGAKTNASPETKNFAEFERLAAAKRK
jgi:hypothetical protein